MGIEQDFSKDQAQRDLQQRNNLPVVGSVYRHYKGGLYVVLAVGINEATGVPMIAYRSNSKNTTWFRTLDNFQEYVLLQSEGLGSHQIPRFMRESD